MHNTSPSACFSVISMALLSLVVTHAYAVAPIPPPALYVVAGDAEATVKWLASPSAASYTLKRSTTSGGPYTTVASSIAGLDYVDTGRTNGTTYYYVVAATNPDGTSANSMQGRVTPNAALAATWPLSQSATADADGIRYEYVDIPASVGTPVHPVASGTVESILPWDGSSSAGNKVVINHGGNRWTQYLHLDSIPESLKVNDAVTTASVIGYVGNTGADHPHLHFNYVVASSAAAAGESRSKNPLEILPHSAPQAVTVSFRTDASNVIDVGLESHRMTVRWVMLQGGGETRLVDYYEVVSQGSVNRDVQSQAGLYLEASAPVQPDPAAKVPFTLSVRPDPYSAFDVQRVVLLDFNGNVIVDVSDADLDNYADTADAFPANLQNGLIQITMASAIMLTVMMMRMAFLMWLTSRR
jgi:hypothetical protein